MTLLVVVVAVGGGAGAPGVSMCPANTDIASVTLRIVAALIFRKVFTLGTPSMFVDGLGSHSQLRVCDLRQGLYAAANLEDGMEPCDFEDSVQRFAHIY